MGCKLMAFAAVALLAAPALAQSNSASPASAPEKPKKICRKEVATGSLFGERTCHTAAEWREIDEANSKGVDSFRHRPMPGGAVPVTDR